MNLSIILNPFFLIPVSGLSFISLFTLAASSSDLFRPQLMSFLAGFVIMLVFSVMDFRIWPRLKNVMYIAGLLLLVSCFFSGGEVRGAYRWLNIFGFTFQPSELVKPFLIIFLADLMAKNSMDKAGNILKITAFFLPVPLLIFFQPDLGNVLVYFFIFILMLIISGIPWRYFIISLLILIVSTPLIFTNLQNYQKQRITAFLNPGLDPGGAGYNAMQSVIAIGSGGLTGLGLGKGTQSRLLFLPEYHTDFIFASLGEELGFTGGLTVIIFYCVLLIYLEVMAYRINDRTGRLVVIGILAQIFVQIFINIGMNLGMLPITGITLPLLSYGGSSILSTFIGIGLVNSVIRMQKSDPLVIR